MTELEFIRAKLGDVNIHADDILMSRVEIAEYIEEYNQIQAHIKWNGQVKLDDSPIPASEWIDYNEKYLDWEEKYEGKMETMDAGMSRPNQPNYFMANND